MSLLTLVFNNQEGQSVVEYIMLVAVVTLLTVSVLQSDAIRELLGEDSNLMLLLGTKIEYAYRHGRDGTFDTSNIGSFTAHESYYNNEVGQSRFVLPSDPYPGD